MTAINLVVQPDAIHLFTDGVACDPDGKILGFLNKASLFPHLSGCLAVRGTLAHSNRIRFALTEHADSFDKLVRKAPMLAVQITEDMASPHGNGFDMVLAGWSDGRKAFEAYQLIYRGEPNPVAWTSSRIGSLVSPYDEGVGAAMRDAGVAPDLPRPSIEEFGRRVTAAQRSVASLTHDGRSLRMVGGYCQMTTITRAGIATKILDRWFHDRLGGMVGGGK